MARLDRRAPTGRGRWGGSSAGLLVVALLGGCRPEAAEPPSPQGQAVATYSDPSLYRVRPAELRRITDQLDPDSPQRLALADGRVTRTELEQAWVAYTQCMRGAGFVVTTSAWDPVTTTGRIFAFSRVGGTASPPATTTSPPATTTPAPGAAAPSAGAMPGDAVPTIDDLTSLEGDRVDACEERYWFPVSAVHAADTPPRMERRLASAVEACMVRRGYAVQGATDFGAMVGAVRGQARGARVQAGRDCLAAALPALYPDLPYYPRP